jgi:hypothetical protein
VLARDRAGNEATLTTSIVVDASAPFVVPGSVVLQVDGREDFVAISTGDTVQLRFLVSEALVEPPQIVLGDAAGSLGLPFTIVEEDGRFYVARAIVTAVPVDGVATIVATLRDAFGHQSANVVPLPAPHQDGVAVVAVPPSPCVVPAEGGNPSTCTDFDGDGFFGPSIACAPDPVDCDDGEPAVFPGVREIPGNGIDDGCRGSGDDPVDEDHVVFVDPNADVSDGALGTPALPFNDLRQALAAASSSGRVVFAATGTFALGSFVDISVPLVGGMDRVTWTRDAGGTRTVLDTAQDPLNIASGYASGVDVNGQVVNSSATLLVDVRARRGVSVANPVTIVASDVTGSAIGDLFLFGNADGSRVLRSTVGAMFPSTANVLFDRIVGGLLAVQVGGGVTVTNSVLFGDNTVVATCSECSALAIVHSSIRGTGAGSVVFNLDGAPGATFLIASNNISASDGRPIFFKSAASTLFVYDNVMEHAAGVVMTIDGQPNVDDAAALEGCAWAGCGDAAGNRFAPLLLAQDQVHLAADALLNPSLNAATATPRTVGMPTTVAGDIDLQCRYADSRADVGADEQ